jgi:signal transduction histidine kinase
LPGREPTQSRRDASRAEDAAHARPTAPDTLPLEALASDGFAAILCDLDARVLATTPNAAELLALPSLPTGTALPGALIDRGWAQEQRATLRAASTPPARVAAGAPRAVAEFELRDRKTVRVLRVDATRDAEGRVLCRLTDLTERAETERTARAVQAAVARTRKLEAIERVTRGIAHDVRNVAVAVRTAAERALRDTDQRNDPRHALDEIRDASERAIELTRDLSLVAGAQPTRGRDSADLADIVRSVCRIAQLSARAGVRFVWEPEDDRPFDVAGPPSLIGRALLNLAINATQATNTGGVIRIELLRHDAHAEITIRDTGAGMDPDTLDRATDPFFTTRRHDGGAGLGLSITLGILRDLNGSLSLESEPGLGTVARVRLPYAVEHATETPAIPARTPGLLIAPDVPQRGVLRGLLHDLGLSVRVADPTALLGEDDIKNAEYAVAVVDGLSMPAARGLLQTLHATGSACPAVVLLSADDPDHTAAPEHVRVLRRPFGIDTLGAAVSDILIAQA